MSLKNRKVISLKWWMTTRIVMPVFIVSLAVTSVMHMKVRKSIYKNSFYYFSEELAEISEFAFDHFNDVDLIVAQMESEKQAHPMFPFEYKIIIAGQEVAKTEGFTEEMRESSAWLVNLPPGAGQEIGFAKAPFAKYRFLTGSMSRETENVKIELRAQMYLKKTEKWIGDNFSILETINGVLFVFVFGVTYLVSKNAERSFKDSVLTSKRITSTDLSLRIRTESNIKEIEELKVTTNEMLDRIQVSHEQLRKFSADLAHELKTPITAMRTQLDVILSKERSFEEMKAALESQYSEVERLGTVVNDLLFLSRVEIGHSVLNLEKIPINDLIEEVIEIFNPVAEERGIVLTKSLEGRVVADMDRSRLLRALFNIVDNAVKFTPNGGRVDISTRIIGSQVQLMIQDNGSGISTEDLPHVFDRLFSKSKENVAEGSGLGLALTQSIIEAHKWDVEIKSAEGHGTTVIISLPA